MVKKVTIQSAFGKLEGTEINVTALVGSDSFASFEVHLEDGTILRSRLKTLIFI